MLNVLFALLPLAFSVLFHFLGNTLTFDAVAKSPEILFFSLMVSVAALGDLMDLAIPSSWDATFMTIGLGLSFGVTVSAGLFGALLYNNIYNVELAVFRSGLLVVSIIVALLFFILSTTTEWMLGTIEEQHAGK
jgi:hypothetical protein